MMRGQRGRGKQALPVSVRLLPRGLPARDGERGSLADAPVAAAATHRCTGESPPSREKRIARGGALRAACLSEEGIPIFDGACSSEATWHGGGPSGMTWVGWANTNAGTSTCDTGEGSSESLQRWGRAAHSSGQAAPRQAAVGALPRGARGEERGPRRPPRYECVSESHGTTKAGKYLLA